MTMIRKQFFIDAEASRRLKRIAAAKGVSEAELIRNGIDRVIADTDADNSDWRAALEKFRKERKSGDFEGLAERVEANRKRRKTNSAARRMRLWGNKSGTL